VDEVVDRLADYCADLTFDQIPDEVVDAATQRLVDTVGCAIGGQGCEGAEFGRRIAPAVDPARIPTPARWLGHADRVTNIEAAGFINSAMIRYLDFNDSYPRGGHPSDALGPIIAHADATGASGRDVITAMVAAYDVFIRVASVTKLRERGWDQGYGIGLGVAAGVGKLLDLDRDRLRHALSISAVSNVPLRNTRSGQLSTWKGIAAAYAAKGAYFGTLLAAEGATGPEAPVSGRHGLKELVTGEFEFHPLEGEGRFLAGKARLKYWPVESHLQPVVWAAMELGERIAVDDIASVAIATSYTSWHETASEPGKWDPRTRETADHSMPYVFVRSLEAGKLDVAAFDRDAYLDPGVRQVMEKVTAFVDDEIEKAFFDDVVLRVTAKTKSGVTHDVEVVNPKGHTKNPMTENEVGEKFIRLTEPRVGSARAGDALAFWRTIADHDTVTAGLDLLANTGGQNPDVTSD
jgi:2-methylcitrate dehydratase